MTERFNNKYRLPSARFPGWDYASHAAYFITICTAGHENYFWEQIPSERPAHIQLTDLGKIAESEWLKTPEIRPDMNLILGKFIVMPDHFHAIIIIGENEFNRRDAMHGVSINGNGVSTNGNGVSTNGNGVSTNGNGVSTNGNDVSTNGNGVSTNGNGVSTNGNGVSTAGKPNDAGKFGPQRKNLGSIVRGFKSAVTMYARKNYITFGWQSRYHDRVIRNDQEFDRISGYIENNPVNWLKNYREQKYHYE